MSVPINEFSGLMVFCEGAHDIAFVRQVLKYFFELKEMKWKFHEYPAPFHLLFPQNLKKHFGLNDLSLDMAHKFYLPSHVLGRGDQLVMLFSEGGGHKRPKADDGSGDSKTKNAYTFLADLRVLLERAEESRESERVVKRVKYLFLNDIDHHGADTVRDNLRKVYATIEDEAWLSEIWTIDESNPFASTAGDIGLYLWGHTTQQGTLEDLTLPLLRETNAIALDQVEDAVDTLFKWETDHQVFQSRIAEAARRKKAILTLAGQRAKPGGSLAVILDQGRDLDKNKNEKQHKALYLNNSSAQNFASFLQRFAGLASPV